MFPSKGSKAPLSFVITPSLFLFYGSPLPHVRAPPPLSPPPPSVTKQIHQYHQYFHDLSVAINISLIIGKRTAPGFIWRCQTQ